MLLQKPSDLLNRSDSLTTTDMSSFTTESEIDFPSAANKSKQCDHCSSSCGTERSASLIDLSEEEIEMLSKTFQKEQRSILIVRTQRESLTRSQLSASTNSQRQLRPVPPSVSFGKLHIREFARRPGDNPGCRIGVSLTIDWEVQDEMTVDLEAYEESRPPRRDRGELNIPSETRMQMLRDSGYSRGEILTYVKMANIARGQRTRTNETLQLAGAQEMAQKLYRGVFNKTLHRSKKKAEKKLIKESMAKDQQLQVLRRQLTAEQAAAANNKQQQPSKAAAAATTTSVAPEEQAPASPATTITRRRVKRDSLAIIAPVAVPSSPAAAAAAEQPFEEFSESSSSSVVEDIVDIAGSPTTTRPTMESLVKEVDC